ALVPITALATTWYQNRHPGIVLVESEDTGLDPQIRMVLMLGFVSFLVLFVGLVTLSGTIQALEEELEGRQRMLDEGAIA
ncbi:MAG: hypothetical protein QGG76_02495, partial [Candidatus Thalassarchaeaceae archaeon]|nr:hypothetical protein [Candidatus Thalassarchaeaceae archaeon]